MYKKFSIFFSFLLFAISGTSQKVFDPDNTFYPSASLSVQRHLFGELGLCYGSGDITIGSCGSVDTYFSKISSECTFDHKNLILGPKFSFEYIYSFFGFRINMIDYTDFKIQDWRLTPEGGLSLGGLLDLYYGYNIPLSKDRLNCVSGNRITLTINLPDVL